MNLLWSLGESGRRGEMPGLPLQRSEKAQQRPTVGKSPTTANGSFVFASLEWREAPFKLISPLSGDAIGKEGGIASSLQAFLAAFQDVSRL
jgi:hypothetical protein